MVSQCECTAQWQRINELATTRRRRGDDDTTTTRRRQSKTTRTQVQPQTPTINGNPSLRIREKEVDKYKTDYELSNHQAFKKLLYKRESLTVKPQEMHLDVERGRRRSRKGEGESLGQNKGFDECRSNDRERDFEPIVVKENQIKNISWNVKLSLHSDAFRQKSLR